MEATQVSINRWLDKNDVIIYIIEYCICVSLFTQSWPILCDPMDYSPPGSSVYGIFPSKNTGVGCRFLLQQIFLAQGSNLYLLHWQADSLPLRNLGSTIIEYYSVIKKEWNSVICSKIDRPREYYAHEINQTEKDKYRVKSFISKI